MSVKPPYVIPPMAAVRATPWNGFRAASLFAGCGGSSLGYRMAGYRMMWASEFVPAAADTYEANKDERTVLDRRDIRDVDPRSILSETGLAEGQLDLLDGSPPCASFSMAGKRASLWGEVKNYSDVKQRVDDLFGEYLRIAGGLRPKVCVAENVPGLTVGVARGFYNEIMAGFDDLGYDASAAILQAEWLGVPQARHRLFFVAVRKDLGLRPAFPDPLGFCYSIRDACPWIEVISTTAVHGFERTAKSVDAPIGVITATTREHSGGGWMVESETDISAYAIGAEWEKTNVSSRADKVLGKASAGGEGKFFQLVRPNPDEPCPTVTATAGQVGAASIVHPTEKRKFSVLELKRLCGFPDDFVLTGSWSQQVERLGRAVCAPVSAALGRTIAEKILIPYKQRNAA